MTSANCRLIAHLQPMMVQTKNLGISDFSGNYPLKIADSIEMISFLSSSSIDMVNFQSTSIGKSTDIASSAEHTNGLFSGSTVSASSAIPGQLANSIGILFAPLLYPGQAPLVSAALAHQGSVHLVWRFFLIAVLASCVLDNGHVVNTNMEIED